MGNGRKDESWAADSIRLEKKKEGRDSISDNERLFPHRMRGNGHTRTDERMNGGRKKQESTRVRGLLSIHY